MRSLVTLCLLTINVGVANAQLSVLDSLPASVIADLLEGDNLTISNLVTDCAPAALGQFIGTSEVPIQQGLVITTGSADMLAGPVSNFASAYHGTPGDLDLDAELMGMSPTMDACVLQFDCIPTGDTLLFNFAFGSEEYPEFTGSAFNDIFAIYLSGPGYQPPQNVAAIPGGTPVSINNVNSGLNAGYYVDNELLQGQYVAYDGFTTNLTAFAVVTPWEQYHFKAAIADVADAIFDSGVMLEAFSFRSAGVSTGISDRSSLPALQAWSVDGMLEVRTTESLLGTNMNITDGTGRSLQRFRLGGAQQSVDIRSFPPGVYTLAAEDVGTRVIARFVR